MRTEFNDPIEERAYIAGYNDGTYDIRNDIWELYKAYEGVLETNVLQFGEELAKLCNVTPTAAVDNYCMGYQDGIRTVLAEKHKGTWIKDIRDDWECSTCHKKFDRDDVPTCMGDITWKYCPECGSDNREVNV